MRALVILALLCGVANAHPLDTAYLRVESHGTTADITFDLDVQLAAQELKVEPAALDGVLADRATELATRLYRTHAPHSTQACTWGEVSASKKGVTVTLRDSFGCPPGDVHWELSFGKQLAPTFQILGKVADEAGEHVITIDKTTTELTLVTGDAMSFGSALRRGLEDVGLLPAGWAHGRPRSLALMLFVVILLLGARGMTKQAKDVGAVIGGLIAGALLGGFAPWSWLVLPMAAIVVVVAGTVAIDKLQEQRWVIAAIGGVLYGVLGQQPVPYALGLSLGPVVALIVLGPLVGALKREGAGRWLIPVGALALAGVAALWIILT